MPDIDPALLDILACPETKQPVRLAEPEIVERLNRDIKEGRVKNRAGRAVEQTMDGGIVREDGAFLYPIIDGIPVMLIDEAIPLETSATA